MRFMLATIVLSIVFLAVAVIAVPESWGETAGIAVGMFAVIVGQGVAALWCMATDREGI